MQPDRNQGRQGVSNSNNNNSGRNNNSHQCKKKWKKNSCINQITNKNKNKNGGTKQLNNNNNNNKPKSNKKANKNTKQGNPNKTDDSISGQLLKIRIDGLAGKMDKQRSNNSDAIQLLQLSLENLAKEVKDVQKSHQSLQIKYNNDTSELVSHIVKLKKKLKTRMEKFKAEMQSASAEESLLQEKFEAFKVQTDLKISKLMNEQDRLKLELATQGESLATAGAARVSRAPKKPYHRVQCHMCPKSYVKLGAFMNHLKLFHKQGFDLVTMQNFLNSSSLASSDISDLLNVPRQEEEENREEQGSQPAQESRRQNDQIENMDVELPESSNSRQDESKKSLQKRLNIRKTIPEAQNSEASGDSSDEDLEIEILKELKSALIQGKLQMPRAKGNPQTDQREESDKKRIKIEKTTEDTDLEVEEVEPDPKEFEVVNIESVSNSDAEAPAFEDEGEEVNIAESVGDSPKNLSNSIGNSVGTQNETKHAAGGSGEFKATASGPNSSAAQNPDLAAANVDAEGDGPSAENSGIFFSNFPSHSEFCFNFQNQASTSGTSRNNMDENDFKHHNLRTQNQTSRKDKKARNLEENPEPSKLKCKICGTDFRSSKLLEFHARKCIVASKYKCPTCKESFNSESDLQFHKELHLNELPYECAFCGKKYKWQKYLQSHVKENHMNVQKIFNCQLCSSSFSTEQELEAHQLTHDKCVMCAKAFGNRTKFRNHIEKCYPGASYCVYCGVNVQAEERPYHYRDCPSKMANVKNCSYCTAKFFCTQGLRQHVKTCHLPKVNRSNSDT